MKVQNMNWDRVYCTWKRVAQACGHTDGLFVDVTFDETELSHRLDEIHWWPLNGVEKKKQDCLDFWKEYPNTTGRTSAFDFGKGSHYTLEMLWNNRNSAEHQAATFIAGFLFRYFGSTRSRLDYTGEHGFGIEAEVLGKLYRIALDKACEHDEVYEWPSACTTVLPAFPELYPVKFNEIETLIEYITERFYLMLRSYQPVRLLYGEPKNQLSNYQPMF